MAGEALEGAAEPARAHRPELLRAQDDIAGQGYHRSLKRTKELEHEEVEHRPPLEILAETRVIEQEILQGIEELELHGLECWTLFSPWWAAEAFRTRHAGCANNAVPLSWSDNQSEEGRP